MKPRYSTRRRIHAAASFCTNGRLGHGYIEDVSLPGCRLISAAAFQVGQTLNLEIQLTSEHPPLRAPLTVVRWVNMPYAGLEFIGMAPPRPIPATPIGRLAHQTVGH
jgi:hypothetical protein